MLKAAFYQVEQCQEPPEEIRAEMQEFAADVGLGFHAFYMDSPKPWYLSEPSSVLRKMVEDASERKFDTWNPDLLHLIRWAITMGF